MKGGHHLWTVFCTIPQNPETQIFEGGEEDNARH